jgi:hypothetical protein
VLTWWRHKAYACAEAGHLVVIADLIPQTAQGDMLLVLDPWPQAKGGRYWLNWMGYACGYRLGGHCVDYYDVQGGGVPPPACAVPDALAPTGCEGAKAEFQPVFTLAAAIDTAAGVAGAMLGGEDGQRLRRGLEAPDSAKRVSCDAPLVLYGGRIGTDADGSTIVSPLGSARAICTLYGEAWSSAVSLFFIGSGQEGWRFAGFGGVETAQELQRAADPLVSAKADANVEVARARELYEVDIPGTGTLLLVDDRPGVDQALNVERPELGLRSLADVLKDPLEQDADRTTLGDWLLRLKTVN